MAKVSFTKLGLSKNQEVKIVNWNEQCIEVKQYLSIVDKLTLISNVINNAHDSSKNFSNPLQVDVFTGLEILYFYTNINFTEKQKENPAKLYDLVKSSGLLKQIIDALPEDEYMELSLGITRSIEAIYTYENSVVGILDTIKSDYDSLNLDATEIQQKLADPENMALLKQVLTKLG